MTMSELSGKQVRKLREAKGWSQNDLSNFAGLGGQSVVSNAERGLMGPVVQHRIAEALGLLNEVRLPPQRVVVTDAAQA